MVPSTTWFPRSLQERAAWYQNFANNAAATGTDLGLAAADVTQIGLDNVMMQYLASGEVTVDAYVDGFKTFRRLMTEGPIGSPMPPGPGDLMMNTPAQMPVGIFPRLAEIYRPRIMASAQYTAEQGVLYGIVRPSGPPPEPTPAPAIIVSAAQTGYLMSVVVTGRALADMWEVWVKLPGAANWTLAKTSTGKSTDVVLTPTTPGEPMQVQVRVQLKRRNANYGPLSDVVYATVNP